LDSPSFERFEEGEIKNAARDLYNQVCVKVAKAQLDMLEYATRRPDAFETESQMNDAYGSLERLRHLGRTVRQGEEEIYDDLRLDVHKAYLSLPALYRRFHSSEEYGSPLWIAIGHILDGQLILDGRFQAGVGDLHNHFLCGKIEDRDLPWDATETDW